MSIDRGMDKEDVIYIYIVEYNSAIENNAICSNMDGPRDYCSKAVRQ